MDVLDVAAQVEWRLRRATWDTSRLDTTPPAAELASFALELAGKKREARKAGRFGQVLVRFALAACVALAGAAAACDKPEASPEATATAIARLPDASGTEAALTSSPRASPARFTDLVLVDPGSDAQPWAVLVPRGGGGTPVLVDRTGAGLADVGRVYSLAAQPVSVGTRDGTSQFLDPLTPAEATGSVDQPPAAADVTGPWSEDERYLASARAIAGQPVVLDAAYNGASALAAGGTHTYLNGVVLRAEPDKPVLAVIDQGLLQSGRPTRPEDVVYVAIRDAERSLYEPGTVVNLRDVVMEQQQTDVDGQQTTVYIPNAALDGARVEPTGHVDLQSLLTPRLQRVDQDLTAQTQEVAASSGTPGTPQPTPTGQPQSARPATVSGGGFRGPSLVDDFLIWMWLSNSGFFRGPSVVINNPPPAPSRGGDVYYAPGPSTGGSTPTTVASEQAAARSTALQAARSAVSGQAAGTGGGVAATNKSAADASARVSAATAKSAAAAGSVSASSAGKSIASAPRGSSSTASRSTGSVSAGARGGSGSSGSGGSVSSGGGGFGGKGIGGSSST